MDAVLAAIVGLPPLLVLALAFLLPAAEASIFVGVLFPGEIAVLLGGVVAHSGRLPLWAVVLAAATGAALGDQVGYLIGRRYGQRLLARAPRRLRRSGDLRRALDLVRRRGAVAVFAGRWAAAMRVLVPGVAGTSGMPRLTFTVANVTGGVFWATVVASIGYLAGASYRYLEERLSLGGELLLSVVVGLVLLWFWRQRRRRAGTGDQAG